MKAETLEDMAIKAIAETLVRGWDTRKLAGEMAKEILNITFSYEGKKYHILLVLDG